MVWNCQRKIPVKFDRRSLPMDVHKLVKVKNATLRRASVYPTPEYRSQARAFQPDDIYAHVSLHVKEVKKKANLQPKDDLPPVSLDEVQIHIRKLEIRKAPGVDKISNKAIKCLLTPLIALLVAIFNACLKNCHFTMWKEAFIIDLPKPGKPRVSPLGVNQLISYAV
ncbi:Probable RNA-directed DNA polymerase from transposon BS [Eumeta japonica]|uniref:Probable RNA-directed DNA polymerase from transposon BS n=1 Tax=Eumeta variegata TaxID=151549 RepID=A0A4C1W729_EUMVA|nr:Probable RNA-directed DNA polymerase from transposon BS [Eumeta japonica]